MRGLISSGVAAFDGQVLLDEIRRDVLIEQIHIGRLEDRAVEIHDDILIERRPS